MPEYMHVELYVEVCSESGCLSTSGLHENEIYPGLILVLISILSERISSGQH